MKKISLLLSVVAVALTACTTTPRHTAWSTPEMQKLKSDCAYEITLNNLNSAEHGAKMDNCMTAHGYKK